MREARGRAAAVALLALLAPSLGGLAAPQAMVALPGDVGMTGVPEGEPSGLSAVCGAVEVPAAPPEAEAQQVVRHAMLAGPVTVWTSLNMGPGSCLDADTLDGLHASDLLGRIAAEADLRASADAALQRQIDAIHIDIERAVAAEAQARAEGDLALAAALAQQAAALAQQMASLRAEAADALAQEAAARSAADDALSARLEAARSALEESLADEAAARAEGDEVLASALAQEAAAWAAEAAALQAQLQEETAARQAGDGDLHERAFFLEQQVDQHINRGAFRGDALRLAGTYDLGVEGSTLRLTDARLGIDRLVVDGQGRVGVGTPFPSAALDIAGDVRWTGSLQDGRVPWARLDDVPAACPADQFLRDLGAADPCGTPAALASGWKENGTAVHLADPAARVGIGVTQPQARLDVAGDVRWSGQLAAGTVPWARLGGFPAACPAGQFAQSVGSALGCAAPPVGAPWQRARFTRTALDTAGTVGQDSSMTIGADGLPVIAYWDAAAKTLSVAHCDDAACTRATFSDVRAQPEPARPSLTIGADGLPIYSFFHWSSATGGDLGVGHCNDLACKSVTTSVLTDPTSNDWRAQNSSIAIGADGLPIIGYYDGFRDRLRVAHCNNVACTSATSTVVDSGRAGRDPSIALGADGLPVISYMETFNADLKVAHCSDVACTSSTTRSIDTLGAVGRWSSIVIGAGGSPVISYTDSGAGDLKVAHCTAPDCSGGATVTALDTAGVVGEHTSITIGADGMPVISYHDATNGDLKLAHCSNAACTSATLNVLDSAGAVGRHTSVTIGPDGLPLVSYFDETNGDLKVVRLANVLGVPHARPR